MQIDRKMKPKKLLKLSAYISVLLCLSGCSSSLYYWGNYHHASSEYASQDITETEYIEILSEIESDAMSSGKKIPPGFYAELGTLYLKTGNKLSAVSYYQKERDSWPESRTFMDKLISGLIAETNSQNQSYDKKTDDELIEYEKSLSIE